MIRQIFIWHTNKKRIFEVSPRFSHKNERGCRVRSDSRLGSLTSEKLLLGSIILLLLLFLLLLSLKSRSNCPGAERKIRYFETVRGPEYPILYIDPRIIFLAQRMYFFFFVKNFKINRYTFIYFKIITNML